MNHITIHIQNLRQPNYHSYVTNDKEYIVDFVFPINGDKLYESWMNKFIESFGNMSVIKTFLTKKHHLFRIKFTTPLSLITSYIIQKMTENCWHIMSINGIDKGLIMLFEKKQNHIDYTSINKKNNVNYNDFYEMKSNL